MNVYDIGVSLGMSSNIPEVMRVISSHMLGVEKQLLKLESGFSRLKLGIGGALSIAAGVGLLDTMKDIANHGEKLLDQQEKLIRAGRTHAEVAQLTARAYQEITKAVPTATGADVLRATNELRMVTGSFAKAQDSVAKSLMLEALIGNATGKSAEGEGYSVWRALEMKGVSMDEKQTDAVMGKITAMIIGSGGKVSGSGVRGFAQQAGPAWQLVNEHAMGGSMPYMINEMGGEKAGTGWNRMYNTVMGTRRWTRQQYEAWKKVGLIDPTQVLGGDAGGQLNFKAGGPVKGGMAHIGDMEEIIKDVIKPAFDAKGISDPKMINAYLAKMFPDSTASRMAARIYQQLENIEKDRIVVSDAKPLTEAYHGYIRNNPKGVKAAYNAQYESMMQAMGGPLMMAALPVMRGMTEFFNRVGAFAAAHPKAMEIIGEGIAAIGIALIGAGGVAILAAFGTAGWIAGGIIALAAAVTMIDWKAAWKGFTDWIESIHSSLKGLFSPWGPDKPKPQNQSYVVPPSRGIEIHPANVVLRVGERDLGMATISFQVRQGTLPISGSRYFDPVHGAPPFDTVGA